MSYLALAKKAKERLKGNEINEQKKEAWVSKRAILSKESESTANFWKTKNG